MKTESPPAPVGIECTVGILTLNSASTLERVLRATQDFQERIICDGGSADGTVELARSYGCRILMQEKHLKRADNTLRDFGGAMRQLIAASTMPWFFKVDSDEVLSTELVDELSTALRRSEGVDGFTVPFEYVLQGHVVADASTYPMREIRIIRVASDLTYSGNVHEHVIGGNHVIQPLHHPLHRPQAPVRILIPKWWRYLRIEVDTARTDPLRLRWRDHARHHLKLAKFLAWRYTKVLRSGSKPRLPLRFEVLRVAYHLVAVVILLAAPRHRAWW